MTEEDDFITLTMFCNDKRNANMPINHHWMRKAVESRPERRRVGAYTLAPRKVFESLYAEWQQWSRNRKQELKQWRIEHCDRIRDIPRRRRRTATVHADTLDELLKQIIELLKNTKR